MSHYLISVFHPNDYDPSIAEDEHMHREIDQLNEAMVAAGIRVFVNGLHMPEHSRTVYAEANGSTTVKEGPHLQTEEHVCGFWVLDVEDMETALEWGRKAAVACRAPIEVRPFH